jgi:chromosomal replication initiation ATPase DnaA
MKQDIFNGYVDGILQTFKITRDELFSKNKSRNLVEARQVLYHMCSERPMSIKMIQDYMMDNGYEINHSSVIYGIKSIKDKMDKDEDYNTVIDRIREWSI